MSSLNCLCHKKSKFNQKNYFSINIPKKVMHIFLNLMSETLVKKNKWFHPLELSTY